MFRSTKILMALTGPTLLVAATALPAQAAADAVPATAGRTFVVEMTGAAERPGPGDPDGVGTAVLHVQAGLERLCYTLSVTAVEDVTAAHVHVGDAMMPGPVVIPLVPPTTGASSGCTDVDRDLLVDILRSPDRYYVNVHSVQFGPGAVRGQLG